MPGMKFLTAFFLICVAVAASAQDLVPAPRAEATATPANVTIASVSSSPAPRENPPQILPDLDDGPLASPTPPLSLPGVQQLDEAFRRSSLGKEADEARLHVQWRELVNRTINDADLVAARAEAEGARTDWEKRQRLRGYYTTWYDRMKARADSAELRTYLQARENEHIGALAQPKTRPETAGGPTPSPTPKRKGKFLKKPAEPDLPR